jgi:hypothetical protein
VVDAAELAGATAPAPRLFDVVQPATYDVAMLNQLGIASRGVSSEEARAAFAGRYLYNDMPGELDRYNAERTFAATRVDINAVLRVTNAYVGGLGVPQQAAAASQALSQAADRYMTLSQASSVDPAAFRQYLESNPQEQETLAQIQRLEALLADMRSLGLPAVEYRQARARLLSSIASDKLPMEVLARTLKGS